MASVNGLLREIVVVLVECFYGSCMRTFRSHVLLSLALIPILLVGFCGCSTLPNLTIVKKQYYQYYNSGEYERDLESVARKATEYAESRAKSGGGKMAVVLDIDETSLSNWKDMAKLDLGYEQQNFERWLKNGNPPAIQPILRFYHEAEKLHLSVFFVTGRREDLKQITRENLEEAGYTNWAGLYLRPEKDKNKSVSIFKTDARAAIEAHGYHIIINIGDQCSDLEGGYADRTYKLPNPFYKIN